MNFYGLIGKLVNISFAKVWCFHAFFKSIFFSRFITNNKMYWYPSTIDIVAHKAIQII